MNKLVTLKKNLKKKGSKESFESVIKKKFNINKPLELLKKSDPVKKDPLILEKGRDFDHNHKYDSDLYHGVNINENLMPGIANTTKELIVGKNHKGDHVVLKAPMTTEEHSYWSAISPEEQESLKPHSLFDAPRFQTSHREAIFKKMADAFGLGKYVPETTLFKNPKDGKTWSAQKFVDSYEYKNKYSLSPVEEHLPSAVEGSGDLHKLAIMETILGHQDRNKSNVRVDFEHNPVLIDNSLSFDYSGIYGSEHPAYAEHLLRNKIPDNIHKWIQKIDENKISREADNLEMPIQAKSIMMQRLGEFKRWSRRLMANPHWNSDLGSGLDIARLHRFHNDGFDKDLMISEAYKTLSRGDSFHNREKEVDQFATTKG